MTSRRSLIDRIEEMLDLVTPVAGAAATDPIRRRLREPLRVAVAGRVKAGKSTLLNALVGERLAPTDAGECTKVVTWYRHGHSYDVTAHLHEGDSQPLEFRRERDQLIIDLGRFAPADLERIEVRWPSSRLQRYTLIDTPGLEAHDVGSAARTQRLLGLTDDGHSEVDAVIYLMRHLHRLDAGFLETFTDRSVAHPSPVNAIAVLSRADEIGAGRLDALDSAAAIARRHAADERVRQLCTTVVPIAGLIAEAGRTLLESEGASLQALAELPEADAEALLLSVDRFVDPGRSPLDGELRRDLLLRLGMFGARFGIGELRSGITTAALSRRLVEVSGIEQLTDLLDEHFGRRATLLKARSGIANLRALLDGLEPSSAVEEAFRTLEEAEASAPELAELRLLHLLVSGAGELTEEESSEVRRLIAEEAAPFRVGLPDDAESDLVRSAVLERLDVWRHKGAFPLASTARREACELVATGFERLYAELG